MALIEANHLYKDFKIVKRQKGLVGFIKSTCHREYTVKHAVEDVSFSIEKGEMVGYIGPNGAGKSTTIKMLSGILYPTSGEVKINGKTPYSNRRENAMRIGVVFGQRSQLYWDLPLSETLELYRKMYRIDKKNFDENVRRFTELLEMKDFIDRPVRQLSLGQKMRAEITVALLHYPDILYLDEPTIGLDVVAKQRIRNFIKEINAERHVTVILTTHDMSDIEEVCSKIILIDKGRILYDGSIGSFYEKYKEDSQAVITYKGNWKAELDLPGIYKIQKVSEDKIIITFDKRQLLISDLVKAIPANLVITDFQIDDARLEDIVKKIYSRESKKENF